MMLVYFMSMALFMLVTLLSVDGDFNDGYDEDVDVGFDDE